jgi:hypothetical protein
LKEEDGDDNEVVTQMDIDIKSYLELKRKKHLMI